MKVLHVITGLEAGGAEVQLAMLVRHTRHEPDVLTLYNPGSVAGQWGDGPAELATSRMESCALPGGPTNLRQL